MTTYRVPSSTVCIGLLPSLTYLGVTSPGALSHFLTVLRDRPVALAIALVESLSRSFKRLTLPITSMVITFWYLLN